MFLDQSFVFTCFLVVIATVGSVKHYNITEKEWDAQFTRGKWTYLGKVAVERARNSVITGVFMLNQAPKGSLLDVGCGEGALSDFLNEEQKKNYLGIDLSKEAVRIAKSKRNLSFMQVSAETFTPPDGRRFDVIVFNEVLYYTEHVEMLKRYQNFLTTEGIIVISVWYTAKIDYLRASIFTDARTVLESIDNIVVSGVTGSGKKKTPISFHIEGFRKREEETVPSASAVTVSKGKNKNKRLGIQ